MRVLPFYRAIAETSVRFRALLPRAREVQWNRLRLILARNANTKFGREHKFTEITAPHSYRQRVPVARYEDFAEYIERIGAGATGLLTQDRVIALEQTGGSTAGPKLIPVTCALLESFRRAVIPWLDDLALAFPAISEGRAYWSISPASRAMRTTAGGIPIGLGSDGAYFGEFAPLVAETLAVSSETAEIGDIDLWRKATCAQLEACEDLAMISVWSPTFLLGLLDHVDLGHKPLAVVSCWDQAASAPWAAELRDRLPGVKVQGKGLIATEGVVSIPLEGLHWPVLAVDSGYYEFMDDAGCAHEASDVREGDDYEVLMTTEGGLYRYAIGDRVRIRGFEGEAPLLEFMGRGVCSTDLCGEKLTEAFVLHALAPLALDFMLLAPAASGEAGYELFVDAARVHVSQSGTLAEQADRCLGANPQYAYARRLGQLKPLTMRRVERPLDTWITHNRERGQRLGDIKPAVLSGDSQWGRRFRTP
jgi:hypothetical protein